MSKQILVVDDSKSVREHLVNVLTEAGFEVLQAGDGVKGRATILKSKALSFVICDVNMPHMDGIEMVRQVKADPEFADLPIVMLTTEGQPELIKQAKEAGASGWLVKPFEKTKLVKLAQQFASVRSFNK